MIILEDQAQVQLNDEHQNHRSDRPSVLLDDLGEAPAGAPLCEYLDADVDQEHARIQPQGYEKEEVVPFRAVLQAETEQDQKHQDHKPGV